MEFKKPTLAYTAESNVEAQTIVQLLIANGIEAYAVEDDSVTSLWAFGTISQFHQPNVFVEDSDLVKAHALLVEFENQNSGSSKVNGDPISATCEDCGTQTEFPASSNGSVEVCPNCQAYMDVGTFEWDEDFGEADPET